MSRTQKIVAFAALGVVVGLVALGWLTFQMNESRKADDGPVSVTEESLPPGFDNNGGVAVGTSGAVGVDLLDDPDVPTVDIYFDLACSHCADFENMVGEDLAEMSASGSAQVIYHPISILDRYSEGTAYSTRAASASFSVAEFAPESFLAFNDALFAAQSTMPPTGLTDEEMAEIASDIGIPSDVSDTFASDIYEGWVANSTEKASIAGVSATPSVAVNGEILDYTEVNYMEPGVLAAYVDGLGQ